ncbi:MAG: aspartate-semialdehyde dehydrogenase, partial [Chloroflexota bacterium]
GPMASSVKATSHSTMSSRSARVASRIRPPTGRAGMTRVQRKIRSAVLIRYAAPVRARHSSANSRAIPFSARTPGRSGYSRRTSALERQRRERPWSGSIVANGNCTAIHLALALAPLHRDFGIERLVVTTMQALSGASYPGVPSLDALDNVVPFIAGEEEKVVAETRKFLGRWDGARFVPADIAMSVHCNRVSVRDGHTETVSLTLRGAPSVDVVTRSFRAFRGRPQELGLPTAPARPIVVRDEPDRPQPVLDRDVERGMASVVGRVREDPVLGLKFVVLGHNTIRGAAGASVLNAELLVAEGCLG